MEKIIFFVQNQNQSFDRFDCVHRYTMCELYTNTLIFFIIRSKYTRIRLDNTPLNEIAKPGANQFRRMNCSVSRLCLFVSFVCA